MRALVGRMAKLLALGLAVLAVVVVIGLGLLLGTESGGALERHGHPAAHLGNRVRGEDRRLAAGWPAALTVRGITLRDPAMPAGSGVEAAELSVAIDPVALVVAQRIDVSRVVLRGIRIEVERDREGKLVWPRVRATGPRDTTRGGDPPIRSVRVRELEVIDAAIYRAGSRGRPLAADSLALRAGVELDLIPAFAGKINLRALEAVIPELDLAIESAVGAIDLGPAPRPELTLAPLRLSLAGAPITVRAAGGRNEAELEVEAPSLPAGALGRFHPALANLPAASFTLHAKGPIDRSRPIAIASVLQAEGARAEVRGRIGSDHEPRSAALTLSVTGLDPSRFHPAAPTGRLTADGALQLALPRARPRRGQLDLQIRPSVLGGVAIDRGNASGRLSGDVLEVTTQVEMEGGTARLQGRGRREPDGRLAFSADLTAADLARLAPLLGVELAGDLEVRAEAAGHPRHLAGDAEFRAQTVTLAERAALWGVVGGVALAAHGPRRLVLELTADSARAGIGDRPPLRLHALELAAGASPAGGAGFARPIVIDAELTATAFIAGSEGDPESLRLAGGARLGPGRGMRPFTAQVDTLALGDRVRFAGKIARGAHGDSLTLELDRFDLRLLDAFLAATTADSGVALTTPDSTRYATAADSSASATVADSSASAAVADSSGSATTADSATVALTADSVAAPPRFAGFVSGSVKLANLGRGVSGEIELTGADLQSSLWPMAPLTAHVTGDLEPDTLAARILIEGPGSLVALTGDLPGGVRLGPRPRFALPRPEASVVLKAMGDSLAPFIAPLLAHPPRRASVDTMLSRARSAAFAASVRAGGAIRNPSGRAALVLAFPAEQSFGRAFLTGDARRDRDTLRAELRADLEHAQSPIIIEARAPLTMNLERGTVALLPDAPLSGSVVIEAFDLGLLEPYLPENLELDGPFDLNATIGGTRAAPSAKGRIELGGGRLALRNYGFELDSLRIAADFDQNRITVHEASGKTEKGHLRLQGGVPVHEGGGDSLAGALEITGLTLRTPQGAVAEGGARMQVSGALRRPLLRGRIVLTKATIPVPERNRKVVRISPDDPWLRGSEVGTPAKAAKASRRLPVDLDLEVDAPRNLWLENKNIDVEIGGNLTLTTPEGMLRVIGELKARQGSVRLMRRRFEVTKGTVTFFGGQMIAPEIDIEAETEIEETTVTVHLTGSVTEPRLELASDPPLEQGDIVSLLVLGRTSDELTSGERSLVGDQARTVAANYVSRELEAKLGNELGLDLVEIDTGGEQERVSVGKYVTPRTLVRVYQQFGTETGGGIAVVYALTDDFDFEVTADDEGENGIDLLWQPR